jgi:hypothetical protein
LTSTIADLPSYDTRRNVPNGRERFAAVNSLGSKIAPVAVG